MQTRWNNWVHVIISTRGSWLPGDPRGFRDHGHRIHSSGDYRSPPPEGEHNGLHVYANAISHATEVVLPDSIRSEIADALASKLENLGVPVRVLAVARVHAHVLMRAGLADAKPLIGRAKQFASHHIRDRLPGSIWAQGAHAVRIQSASHYRSTVDYIRKHESQGAAVWIHERWRGR